MAQITSPDQVQIGMWQSVCYCHYDLCQIENEDDKQDIQNYLESLRTKDASDLAPHIWPSYKEALLELRQSGPPACRDEVNAILNNEVVEVVPLTSTKEL